MADTIPPATPVSLLRNLAQELLLVLLADPDDPQILLSRRLMADWYAIVALVIELLDAARPGAEEEDV